MNVRGILIDPVAKAITEVEVEIRSADDGGYHSIKAHLQVGLLDTVRLGRHHVMWVDDEALIKDPPHHLFALPAYYPNPIAGRGLITGAKGPETVACTIPVPLIQAIVIWPDIELAGFVDTHEEDVEIAPGIRGTRHTRQTVFRDKPGPAGTGDDD